MDQFVKLTKLANLILNLIFYRAKSSRLSIRKHTCKKNNGMNTINQFHLIDWSMRVVRNEKNINVKHEINVADNIGLILD